MGMGFPMGPGIPWESHGNGNKTQNLEWEWETTSVGMGITCTPMGIIPKGRKAANQSESRVDQRVVVFFTAT